MIREVIIVFNARLLKIEVKHIRVCMDQADNFSLFWFPFNSVAQRVEPSLVEKIKSSSWKNY